ncbi:MAG: hypothetical protein VW405_10880 [Rhodospirillaceae bacterium]
MTEIASVSAAQRVRLLNDAQRRVDQERQDVVQARLDAFAENRRRTEIIDAQVDLQEQRLRDKRNDLEFELEVGRTLDEQQRIRDTVDNDALFQRDQDATRGELNAARDAREGDEARLLRDLEADRNDALELDALVQRAEDLRQALIDREDRLVERRLSDRDAEIQAQIDLRVSLDRINQSGERPLRPQDATPGSILDVRA